MNKTENIVLLACLTRFDTLLTEAVKKIDKYQLFDNLRDPQSAFIWSAVKDIQLSSETFPVRAMVEAEIDGRLNTMLGLSDDFKSTIWATVDAVYALPTEDLSEAAGKYYLDIAIEAAMTSGWLARVRRMSSIADMKVYVNEVSADISNLASDGEALAKPLMTPEKFMVKKDRIPFGVRALDLISGGGLAPGEVFGLLGPTGGGKTIMAVSMACERAQRRQHVQLISYEQPTEGDISERIFAYMTGLSVTEFRDKNFVDLNSSIVEKLKIEQEKYGEYLSVVDLASGSRGTGGAGEVIQSIDKQAEKGEMPSLVIVDWLGAMVQRYLAFNNQGNDQYRQTVHIFLDALGAHARSRGYSLVVNHQLRTDAARRRPEVKPNSTEAMECRSFAYFMDAVGCLGTMSTDTHVGWLVMDKFRRGAVGDVLVRMNGEHVRFEPADGFIVDHRGAFISEDEAPPDIDEEKPQTVANDQYKDAYPI